MNAQVNTLKSIGFQKDQPNEPIRTWNIGFHTDFQTRLIRTLNPFKKIFKNLARNIVNHRKGITWLQPLLNNPVVKYVAKILIFLVSSINELISRIMNGIAKLLISATDAFFQFMDEFFMMDEEWLELVVVSEDDGSLAVTAKGKRNSAFLRQHGSRYQFIVSEKLGCSPIKSGKSNLDENPNERFRNQLNQVSDFKQFIIEKYYRLLHGRTLNLFKPLFLKLPLKSTIFTHQTPV
jgi:hypothetical protein